MILAHRLSSAQTVSARRRLTLAVRLPKDSDLAAAPHTEAERRQEEANGISETRLAFAGGRVIGSRGFTVAADRRSALKA